MPPQSIHPSSHVTGSPPEGTVADADSHTSGHFFQALCIPSGECLCTLPIREAFQQLGSSAALIRTAWLIGNVHKPYMI